MRTLKGDQFLARIFIGVSNRWKRQPLFEALVERLRKEGFAGATVFRGIAGFGARSILHTTRLLRLSEDLPVVIELVDGADRLDALEAILDEMVPEGLVTLEKVQVLRYAPVKPPPTGRAKAK
ncbi:MAG: DUF190 domain-containing protein [Deltaproteobacteria bacterium]